MRHVYRRRKEATELLGFDASGAAEVLDAWVDARGQEQKKHEEHNGAEKAD
jgi:hypothetical protein